VSPWSGSPDSRVAKDVLSVNTLAQALRGVKMPLLLEAIFVDNNLPFGFGYAKVQDQYRYLIFGPVFVYIAKDYMRR